MQITIRKEYLIILCSWIFLASIAGPPSVWAQSSPVDGAMRQVQGEQPIFEGYPLEFDGIGRVDRIGPDEVVIDDTLHHLTSSTTYNTPGSKHGSLSGMHVGYKVGFLENSDGGITSLWLIEKSRKRAKSVKGNK